jgi:hypothetical protein
LGAKKKLYGHSDVALPLLLVTKISSNALCQEIIYAGQTAACRPDHIWLNKIKSAESDNVSEYNPSDDDETLSEDEEGGTLDSITTM